MKALWALLVVMFVGSHGLQIQAQQLAPVGNGFSWGPLIIIAIIGAAIAAAVLWHKRNPSKADEAIKDALTTAKDDASALAHKAVEAVQTLVKTNREQAIVIASPPVQAAINGPAPIAPQPTIPAVTPVAWVTGGGGTGVGTSTQVYVTPQPSPIAPQSAIAPFPVSSPQPATQGAAMPDSSLPDWRSFTFQPATTYFQQKFNSLQSQYGPGAAYYFMEAGDSQAGATENRAALELAWGVANGSDALKNFYRAILNQFGGQGNPLGLSAIEIKSLAHQERAYILASFK